MTIRDWTYLGQSMNFRWRPSGALRSKSRRELFATLLIPIVMIAVVTSNCANRQPENQTWYEEEMSAAKKKWETLGPACYQATISRYPGLPTPPRSHRVLVCEHRLIARTNLLTSPATEDLGTLDSREPIQGLFDEIQSAIASNGPTTVRATYESEFGYPVKISIVTSKVGDDNAVTIEVVDFERLPCAKCVPTP